MPSNPIFVPSSVDAFAPGGPMMRPSFTNLAGLGAMAVERMQYAPTPYSPFTPQPAVDLLAQGKRIFTAPVASTLQGFGAGLAGLSDRRGGGLAGLGAVSTSNAGTLAGGAVGLAVSAGIGYGAYRLFKAKHPVWGTLAALLALGGVVPGVLALTGAVTPEGAVTGGLISTSQA